MIRPAPFAGFHARALSSFAAAALVLALCALASAQQQQQQPPVSDDDEIITVESNLVRLNVGVADRQGRPVINLGRQDFTVYEDGVRQTIQSFEPTQSPFSLILMLDLSGSTLNIRTQLRMAATRFLDALGPEDRISVVAFWGQKKVKPPQTIERVETWIDFTTDRRKVAYVLTDVESKGNGDTNLYKALGYALGALAKEGARRKAIVVLTDGIDSDLRKEDRQASAAAKTGEEALASVKPEASAALNSVLNAADRQGVTIYPLALSSGDLKRVTEHHRRIVAGYPPGEAPEELRKLTEPTPQQVAIYGSARARLELLANRTGGRLHTINRLEDLGRQYAEVAAEMRTLYSIAYQSSNAGRRDGKWREIKIEVTRPDTVARTRPGYYAR
jgi:VWFA-related protein